MKRPLLPLPVEPATAARLQRHYDQARATAYRTAGWLLFIGAAVCFWLGTTGCRAAYHPRKNVPSWAQRERALEQAHPGR